MNTTVMKAGLLAALACGLLLSCGRARNSPRPQKPVAEAKKSDVVWCRILGASVTVPNQKAEEWAIRRATFLHQIKPQGKKRSFIEVKVSQPTAPLHFPRGSTIPAPPRAPVMDDMFIPDSILEDLRAAGRQVARASECVISRKGVQDRASGERECTLFSVCDICFLSTTAAEVTGGLWLTPERAASYTYVIKKIEGVWVVTGERMTSDS